MPAESDLEYFAVSPPGLEAIMADEIIRMGLVSIARPRPVTFEGGVPFRGDLSVLYRANLMLRTATRILVRLGQFQAMKFVELRRKTSNLPWDRYLAANQPVCLRVTCRQSKLYHTGAVAQRIAEGIGDRLGKLPPVQPAGSEETAGAALIAVRIHHNECTISLDSSGELLHRRGYRRALAKAPLRETLAAGMLLASGWDCASPLLDPFCGSGTIPIEAALLAANIPPGANRRFGFMDWPGYQAGLWQTLLNEARNKQKPVEAIIQGSDRDSGAIHMATQNAQLAGVADAIQFSRQAFSAVQPPSSKGWLVTNPPYGVRVSKDRDLRDLYTGFGDMLRARCPGWQVAYLCNDDHLATLTRIRFEKGLSLVNGGIPVKLTRGYVPDE